ncbi:hypothetical protein Hdeb2414_s0006g00224321 [Helianthus debilis subsp. tardiflorus]
MWMEIIFGLVIYRLVRHFFYDDNDKPVDFSFKGTSALFVVAHSTIHPDYFPPDVVTYEQWALSKPEKKSISGWIKGALPLRSSDKNEMQDSIQQKLGFILSTAPMLELNNNKRLLGEFVEFKEKNDDHVLKKHKEVKS